MYHIETHQLASTFIASARIKREIDAIPRYCISFGPITSKIAVVTG
jgi:hypothetical protein